MIHGVPLQWRVRHSPLAPCAVAGQGAAARLLVRRVLALDAAQRMLLQGVGGRDVVVIVGDEAALPWVDGAQYLGRDMRCPGVWLPTALEPTIIPSLVGRAVDQSAVSLPAALLRHPPRLVSLAEALPLDVQLLTSWLEAHA